MSQITWIKLSTSMFDDKKIKLIRKLPNGNTVLLVWIQLLVEAGKCNLTGRIMLDEQVPLTDEMFAIVYDLELQEVRHAFSTLEQFGMIGFDESQVIRISNWEKHQNIEGMEQTKRLRQARNKRYQEKKKQLSIESDDKTSYKTVDKTQEDILDLDLEIEVSKSVVSMNAFDFYEQNFGVLRPFVIDEINNWVTDLSEELVIEAMKKSLRQHKSWGYTMGILKEWDKGNIRTLHDVEVRDKFFQQNKKKNGMNRVGKIASSPIVENKEDEELGW
ncbi:phage replisome organizer N-terminal domain-containing protein [Gottfriedia sp. NPDC056225]|uniref:phage replisome organizer N-terminal domain-containing protein n=1 Tax=Gottfriedia sp. NPDC056225 TaxID=3345751 RepID=UPI0035D6F449